MFRSNNNAIASGLLLGLSLLSLAVLMHEPCVTRDIHALSGVVAISQSKLLRMQVPAEIYASPEWLGNSPHSAAVREMRKVFRPGFFILFPVTFAPKVSSQILNSVFNF